jgi:hypothetical protein
MVNFHMQILVKILLFFPGHVFILEKIPSKDEPYFYFYQSYINNYDLKDHIKKIIIL